MSIIFYQPSFVSIASLIGSEKSISEIEQIDLPCFNNPSAQDKDKMLKCLKKMNTPPISLCCVGRQKINLFISRVFYVIDNFGDINNPSWETSVIKEIDKIAKKLNDCDVSRETRLSSIDDLKYFFQRY